jgi:hypothetical protein
MNSFELQSRRWMEGQGGGDDCMQWGTGEENKEGLRGVQAKSLKPLKRFFYC